MSLLKAAQDGDLAKVKDLIKGGQSVNVTDEVDLFYTLSFSLSLANECINVLSYRQVGPLFIGLPGKDI